MPEHLKTFEGFLARRGLRLTHSRRLVFGEVFRRHDHADADSLCAALRPFRVSRATVYRTLDLMERAALVRRVDARGGAKVVEHVPGHPHHHHLVCSDCGRIINFESPEMERAHRRIIEAHGFEESDHSYMIFGRCRKCAGSRRRRV